MGKACCDNGVSNHLDGLSPEEQRACVIAERVLGAAATPWDIHGRQGAVEAMLTLTDGRQAAFEVTTLAAEGARHLDSLLANDMFSWPSPGKWWWSVWVGDPADVPGLRDRFRRLALQCEAAGVTRPEMLPGAHDDPDLAWLIKESSPKTDMVGHPEVPAVDGERVRHTMVVPAGRCDMADGTLSGLREALADAFRLPHMSKRLEKVARAEADEHHLFVLVHDSALPFAVADDLCSGTTLPPDPAPLPAGVTHLWIAPTFGRRVLLWAPDGWQQHYPYDD